MHADSYQDVGTVATASASRNEAQLRTAAVKRREAFTQANVGLSRAIGTTIIVSPLDMAGQPGACIVTAVLQAGLAIVDTTAHGEAEIQTALNTVQRFVQIKTWRPASWTNIRPVSPAYGAVLAACGGVQQSAQAPPPSPCLN